VKKLGEEVERPRLPGEDQAGASEVLFCAGKTRDGADCRRLGHRVDNDGVRWCATHSPETYAKQPIQCRGFGSDGIPCRSFAETTVEHEDAITPVCPFHATMHGALGALRTPSGYKPGKPKRLKPPRRPNEVIPDEAPLDEVEEELLGSLRLQLRAAGPELGPLILNRLKKMLRSDNVAANSAAIKILLERLAPVDEGAGVESESLGGDISTMTDRQLRAIVFPTPKAWGDVWHRDKNFGSKVEWVIAVQRRHAHGAYVDAEELAEAKKELWHIRHWRTMTEPLADLSFGARPAA
jgi:hypothetical protein